ncbi:MAG: 5-formyltetrahydrofolate cyclo-ligase [Chloroflexi bacterium]|nr:5-formyltetrahydrofolate cyclo-ligase [Chloroflexota bacterium]
MARSVAATRSKEELRQSVWETLERERVARFPGARGRVPNFEGASRAAERVRGLDAWREARVLKCNPDSPQLPLRRAALREGKTVYMAVPRLRREECFVELDPSALGRNAAAAATIGGAFRFGRLVSLGEMRLIDLVVCGSVAVSVAGARVGKGGGYSDLEYALLSAYRKITPATPIVTTVHPLQVVPAGLPMHHHDIPVDYIATPDTVIHCERVFPRPEGIFWDILPPEKIEAIPVLRRMWEAHSAAK